MLALTEFRKRPARGGGIALLLAIAVATAENRSSMLQDLSSGRVTEIDAINGAVVREGIRRGIPTPVNKTLTMLIKTLEKIPRESPS